MNRSDTPKQLLQRGNRVSVDSKGRKTSTPMGENAPKTRNRAVENTREYLTGMERRKQAAGLRSGGKVKKSGRC